MVSFFVCCYRLSASPSKRKMQITGLHLFSKDASVPNLDAPEFSIVSLFDANGADLSLLSIPLIEVLSLVYRQLSNY